jgi:hypothetical protein
MSPESWMLFALKELLLCLTPGPAVLLVVFQGMGLGHRASVAGNIGVLGRENHACSLEHIHTVTGANDGEATG